MSSWIIQGNGYDMQTHNTESGKVCVACNHSGAKMRTGKSDCCSWANNMAILYGWVSGSLASVKLVKQRLWPTIHSEWNGCKYHYLWENIKEFVIWSWAMTNALIVTCIIFIRMSGKKWKLDRVSRWYNWLKLYALHGKVHFIFCPNLFRVHVWMCHFSFGWLQVITAALT